MLPAVSTAWALSLSSLGQLIIFFEFYIVEKIPLREWHAAGDRPRSRPQRIAFLAVQGAGRSERMHLGD
jgi:hypothetical protein